MMQALQIIDVRIDDEDKRYAPTSAMAGAIFQIVQSKGRCTPQDLFSKGFTPAEVTQHWHIAHSLASLQARQMNEGDA